MTISDGFVQGNRKWGWIKSVVLSKDRFDSQSSFSKVVVRNRGEEEMMDDMSVANVVMQVVNDTTIPEIERIDHVAIRAIKS